MKTLRKYPHQFQKIPQKSVFHSFSSKADFQKVLKYKVKNYLQIASLQSFEKKLKQADFEVGDYLFWSYSISQKR
jgi:hypothetical protein